MKNKDLIENLTEHFVSIISETNGVSLSDTLELLTYSEEIKKNKEEFAAINEFRSLLTGFQHNELPINTLLDHPIAQALFNFFKLFPAKYHEEHIHLTGSLTADFLYPHLTKLLNGPNKNLYQSRIQKIYGDQSLPLQSSTQLDQLIRLKEGGALMSTSKYFTSLS